MNIYAKPETEWPLDLPSAVFLPRAVLRIGQAKFGDEWTGKEPLASLEIFSRNEPWGQAKQRQIRAEKLAIEWLNQSDAEKEKRRKAFAYIQTLPMRPLRGSIPLGPMLSPEEWREIRDWTDAKNADAAPLVERFDAVCRAVVERCLASLPTFFRAPDGEMKRILESWWNLTPANWPSRFTTGQVNIFEPMRNDTLNGGSNRCWLYVDAAGLEAWESTLTASTPTSRREAEALRELVKLCAEAEVDRGPWPKAVDWKPTSAKTIGVRGAERVWAKAREKYPMIGTSRKPRKPSLTR